MTDDKNMIDLPENYEGREQSYVKHNFLKNYLERAAYNLLSACNDFVYVDGFSGPWQSGEEGYEDTSFAIAIEKLTSVKRTYQKIGHPKKVRCLFIEKDAEPYARLLTATRSIPNVSTKALHGSFEDLIDDVVHFIGRSFSFVFIDPKGWTGYSLTKISPVLHRGGEVIINFMYDYINRFIEDTRPEIINSYNSIFGDDKWYQDFLELVENGEPREKAILSVYISRLKKVGKYRYVTWTRIKHPTKERTYYHLIYATRHPKGLYEFRGVEAKTAYIQERIRDVKKQSLALEKRTHASGIEDLFGITEQNSNVTLEQEKLVALTQAKKIVTSFLNSVTEASLGDLYGQVFIIPLVSPNDLENWLFSLRKSGKISIPEMKPRAKRTKSNYRVIRNEPFSVNDL